MSSRPDRRIAFSTGARSIRSVRTDIRMGADADWLVSKTAKRRRLIRLGVSPNIEGVLWSACVRALIGAQGMLREGLEKAFYPLTGAFTVF